MSLWSDQGDDTSMPHGSDKSSGVPVDGNVPTVNPDLDPLHPPPASMGVAPPPPPWESWEDIPHVDPWAHSDVNDKPIGDDSIDGDPIGNSLAGGVFSSAVHAAAGEAVDVGGEVVAGTIDVFSESLAEGGEPKTSLPSDPQSEAHQTEPAPLEPQPQTSTFGDANSSSASFADWMQSAIEDDAAEQQTSKLPDDLEPQPLTSTFGDESQLFTSTFGDDDSQPHPQPTQDDSQPQTSTFDDDPQPQTSTLPDDPEPQTQASTIDNDPQPQTSASPDDSHAQTSSISGEGSDAATYPPDYSEHVFIFDDPGASFSF